MIAPIPLLVLCRRASLATRVGTGLAYGGGFFGSLFVWTLPFGPAAWITLVITQAMFVALFAAIAGPSLKSSTSLAPLATAALWTLTIDVLRSRLPFGGLSWGNLSEALVGSPLQRVVPLGGALALTFVGATVACLIARVDLGWRRLLPTAAVLALLVLMPWTSRGPNAGFPQRVAVIQGGTESAAAIGGDQSSTYGELTRSIDPSTIDLVVWPESVVQLPTPLPGAGGIAPEAIARDAALAQTPIIAGVSSRTLTGFRNSAIAVSGSGTLLDTYDKVHPVPFGEYVPLRWLFGGLPGTEQIPRDMEPGRSARSLSVGAWRIATPISFEVTFSRVVHAMVADGAQLIIAPTDTSAFGPQRATTEQELQLTKLRAIESGLWAIQVSPTGVTAIVDPHGAVTSQSSGPGPTIVQGSVRIRDSDTIFGIFGEDASIAILSAIVALWAAVGGIHRRERENSTNGNSVGK